MAQAPNAERREVQFADHNVIADDAEGPYGHVASDTGARMDDRAWMDGYCHGVMSQGSRNRW